MPLLKDTNARRIAHEAVVLDLGDLRKEAERLREAARVEAQQILQAAREEAAQITGEADQRGFEQGRARGHAEGLQAGRTQGQAEALAQTQAQLDQLQQAWMNAAQHWDNERRTMLLDARQSVLELAIAIAAKITKRMPEVDPSVVMDQIAAAVDQMSRPADVRIRIHPGDRQLIEEAMPQLVAATNQLQHVHLVDDPQVSSGGCMVSYGKGTIDATLETQLDRIVRAILPGADAPPDQEAEAAAPATPPPADTDSEADTDPPGA